MLYEFFSGIYNYLFSTPEPSPRYNSAIEDLDTSLVLVPAVRPTDEELSIVKAKKKNIDPFLYQLAYMAYCNACSKFRFHKNVSYVSKEEIPMDFLTSCNDDEGCIKSVKEKASKKP